MVDTPILLSILASTLTTIGTVGALFLWNASKIDNLTALIHAEMKDFHASIRDFHDRLCILEERQRNLPQIKDQNQVE